MATIQEVYIALFGRPADPIGYDYYVNAIGDRARQHQLRRLIILSPEGALSTSPRRL